MKFPIQDLHIHEEIMALFKIVLRQTNANWKNRVLGNTITFDPSCGRDMSFFMNDEIRPWIWNGNAMN